MNPRVTCLMLSAAALLAAPIALARDLSHDQALQLRKQGVIVPFEQVTERIEQLHPRFTLLEAELEDEDGMLVYEVEIITAQGVVRELELDARNGQLLSDEEDD